MVARSLEARGVAVERTEILGDDLDAIADAVRRQLDRGIDLVCTTGGLGPTHDDLTMEAVARATGRPLAIDPDALALVERRSRGIAGDPGVQRAVREKQATLPAGSTVLAPVGTAPGCALRHDGAVVVVLPGPPWELEAMWDAALCEEPLAGLLARATPPAERVLRVHATPESRVVEALEGMEPGAWERLRVGICARDGELEITIRSGEGGDAAADALERLLARELGEALHRRDGATVDEVVARSLTGAGQTVAVAESCTGGGLGARLTARPGSSAYVVGGVVAYADEVKRDVLGVGAEILRRHGAVSAECARAMAEGVRRLVASDWALSVTGVAGPGGGSAQKPVGLVHLGIAGPGGAASQELRLRGDRQAVRDRSSALALHLLRRVMAGERVV